MLTFCHARQTQMLTICLLHMTPKTGISNHSANCICSPNDGHG